MSVKFIEREIIASCLSEENYGKCYFLEQGDFHYFAEVWTIIQKHEGRYEDILLEFNSILKYGTSLLMVSLWKPERLALKLLEISFQRSLLELLTNLTAKTRDDLESMNINNLQVEVPNLDILEVIDTFPEYAKLTLSGRSTREIENWSAKCKKRIDVVKEVY